MTLENVEPNDRVIPKLAVSKLAKSYHHRCEKHVKLVASKSTATSGANMGPLKEAHFQRGYQFEEQVAESFGAKLVDHTHTSPSMSKQALRDAQPGQVLYQLTFEMPSKFYQEEAGNAYQLGRFIPDFLFVHKDTSSSTGKRICIVDAKSSKAMNTSHQFQVASYAYLLGYIVKDVRNIRIDVIGGVLLPFSKEPEMFRVDLLLPKIELFYTKELPDIVQDKKIHWLFNTKCKNCEFVNICREDAYGTPGAVPYLTESRLKSLSPPEEDDISDIEDLVDHLSSLTIQEKRQRAVPSYMASEPEFSPYATAYRSQKPQFRGNPIVTLAKSNNHDIFISLVFDPMFSRVCAYVIRVYDLQSNSWCRDLECSFHVSAATRSYSRFIELDANMVQDLAKVLSSMETQKSCCTIFVSSNQVKDQVQKCCLRITTMDPADEDDAVDQDTVKKAMDCLLALFQDSKMLAIPGIAEFPADLEHKVLAPLVVDIEQLVRENVALGVPGFYSLKSMARWMTPDHEVMSDDDLYQEWHTATTDTVMDDLLMAQADMLRAIVTKYRSFASSYEDTMGKQIYCMESVPFKWPTTKHFRSNVFGRLAFFKIMECLSGCNNVRSSRLLDLTNSSSSSSDHGIKLQYMRCQVVPKSSGKPDYQHWFKAIPEGNVPIKLLTDNLSKTSMREYLLVPNDREGMMQAVQFPDLAFRNKMFIKYPINTVNVNHVSDDGLDVILDGYTASPKLEKLQYYRLYKRYVDFNTDKILDAMLQIDQRENSTFEQLVTDPNTWADTLLEDDDAMSSDARATALRLRDDFKMSPSQKDISAQIIKKRLQIVWGPPGSGKTEFLALFINWYIMHLYKKPSNGQFIIGVTAFTRHAIMNLLQRIATVRQRHASSESFTIISMEGYDKSQKTSEMIQCKANKLKSTINKHHGPVVVGGTVWDWYKVKNEWRTWQGCSMMIIDESSQLLVSDAAVAVDCLDQKQGRLIIAGDHMQLGPILHNKYPKLPASDPLLFGSIQQCLMRTEDNKAIPPQEFLLRKGTTHDFGPNTIQLKDNWRMNDELNSFFKQIYGHDLAAHYPKRILQHDWQKWKMGNVSQLEAALDPKKSISLVKVSMVDGMTEEEAEAQVIGKLVHAHLTIRMDPTNTQSSQVKPNVMIVTPHHRQRVAVERELEQWVETKNQVTVDTVEKMQGQESELVIACFAFNDVGGNKIDFLLDFKRWNVAISRARSKVIIVTTDYMLNLPKNKGHNALDLFEKRESAEGWGFVCLLQDWAKKADAVVDWSIKQ